MWQWIMKGHVSCKLVFSKILWDVILFQYFGGFGFCKASTISSICNVVTLGNGTVAWEMVFLVSSDQCLHFFYDVCCSSRSELRRPISSSNKIKKTSTTVKTCIVTFW